MKENGRGKLGEVLTIETDIRRRLNLGKWRASVMIDHGHFERSLLRLSVLWVGIVWSLRVRESRLEIGSSLCINDYDEPIDMSERQGMLSFVPFPPSGALGWQRGSKGYWDDTRVSAIQRPTDKQLEG